MESGNEFFSTEYPYSNAINTNFMLIEHEYPFLKYLYFQKELDWDGFDIFHFSRKYYYLVYLACFIYSVFIFYVPKLLANKRPFSLEKPLKYWNLFLAVFSLIGALRVMPFLIIVLYKYGFVVSICSPTFKALSKGPTGLWLMLFIYSKYFELFDTVFIVLRKKQLSFLHWYHHLTVLLFTWDAYTCCQCIGIYFCGINYLVHAVMYYYYYLASCGKKPKWGITITILQIVQMVIGTFLTLAGLHYSSKYNFPLKFPISALSDPLKVGCFVIRNNLIMGFIMYVTYFILFCDFFLKRYITKGVPLIGYVMTKSGEKTQ